MRAQGLLCLVLLGLGALTTGCGHADKAPRAITIGVLSDCTGPFAAFHDLTLAGVQLPLIQRGGGRRGPDPADGVDGVSVRGRPIRLVFGCNDTNMAVSTLDEARRLVEREKADVLIGPLSGNEEFVLQEYARRKPGVAFVDGSGSDQLQHPPANFFSFHTDGAQWMAGLGAYAFHTLGWRTAVTIASTSDLFSWAQVAGFTAEFCSLGGDIVKRIWIQPGTIDLSGVVAQVPRAGVDGFFVESSDALVAMGRGYPGLRGNIARKLIPGALAYNNQIDDLGVRRVVGLVFGSAVHLAGGGPELARYSAALLRAFPEVGSLAATPFDIFYYDAMSATLKALGAVDGDLSAGERRFMAALARVRVDAPNGPVRLNGLHQAIASNYLVRVASASGSVPLKTVPNVEPTFGGYFSRNDPPPSKTTPACKHGHPPPWTR